ncbi:hypothetical protein KI387_031130, partial [Taxus chinensis]
MKNTSAVQRLYEICMKIFSDEGEIPPPPAIARLKAVLDGMKPPDVGLDENEENEEERRTNTYLGPSKRRKLSRNTAASDLFPPQPFRYPPDITYVHIHECDSFSMGIFCLPKSAVIPLHNHFGMTVLSKVLYGSMHVLAYDWYDQHQWYPEHFDGMRLAKLKVDTVYNASSGSSVLYPTKGGNIHSFTALTSCAVLDVLSPPYADGEPSYYSIHPDSGLHCKWKEYKDDNEYEDCV